jgi:hypothetical protein
MRSIVERGHRAPWTRLSEAALIKLYIIYHVVNQTGLSKATVGKAVETVKGALTRVSVSSFEDSEFLKYALAKPELAVIYGTALRSPYRSAS